MIPYRFVWGGPYTEEDTQNVLFNYRRFASYRSGLTDATIDLQLKLMSKDKWDLAIAYNFDVKIKLRRLERIRSNRKKDKTQ